MQKVKIFKTHVNELKDTNSLESNLNLFVQDKTIISVTQSVVPKPGTPEAGALYFMVVTVVYDDNK